MKKTSILMLSLICLGLIVSFVQFSKATEYYEWVQNPSFENYINYFEDYGAESNVLNNSGVLYGNFSGTGSNGISTSYTHSGLRSFYANSDGVLWYNLTTPKIGADIINASMWLTQGTSGSGGVFSIRIYYIDNTYDSYGSYGTFSDDVLADFLSAINPAKYITAFQFYHSNSGSTFFDDLVLYDVDDDAQYYISYNTKPWYEPQIWSVDIYQYLTSGQKHSGNWSYHDFIATGNEGYGYQGGVSLIQSFIGLDSDLVNDFRLYAMTDNEIDLTVQFLYSDETYSSDTKTVNVSSWTLYVYDVAIPDKTIVGFKIIPYSTTIYTVNLYIDDISLTATTQYIPIEVIDSDYDGIPDTYDTNGIIPPVTPPTTMEDMQISFVTGFPVLLIFALFCIPTLIYMGVAGLIAGVNISCIVIVWMGIGQPYFIALMVLFDVTMIFWKVDVSHSVSEQRIVQREGTRPLRKALRKIRNIEED